MTPPAEVIWLFGSDDSQRDKSASSSEREASVNESISRHPSSAQRKGPAPIIGQPSGQPSPSDQELADVLAETRRSRMAALSLVDSPEDSESDDSDEPAEPDARRLAVRAVARRALSAGEVRRVLVRAHVSPVVADDEVQRLVASGILNDTELADRLAQQLSERKHLGASAIAQKLKERLIDTETIRSALDRLSGETELDNAIALAERKVFSLGKLEYPVAERRLWGHLQRKGFSSQTIKSAVQTAMADFAHE